MTKIDFTLKPSGRKFLKFPHCDGVFLIRLPGFVLESRKLEPDKYMFVLGHFDTTVTFGPTE